LGGFRLVVGQAILAEGSLRFRWHKLYAIPRDVLRGYLLLLLQIMPTHSLYLSSQSHKSWVVVVNVVRIILRLFAIVVILKIVQVSFVFT
jgi:hypothetical protein